MHDKTHSLIGHGRSAMGRDHLDARSEEDALGTGRSAAKMAKCEHWYLGRLLARITHRE